jgi:magnesium chelatase subunit D
VRPPFPLSAIVGQERLVEALLANAVSPEVGGVLVRGERGTAKSTAVRALAPLLPAVPVAAGQTLPFAPGDLAPDGPIAPDAAWEPRPAPLVELPVGATTDRLLGSLDLRGALERREHALEPGLMARAHQGVLYVDEVNLLPDHLVDVLLDAAASGVCTVEREAVSVRHSARFLLVGTMNPEEGELRPQLLDRFGLGVEVRGPREPAVRAEIVRRRLAYEADPDGFAAAHAPAERALAERIAAARDRLPGVRLPEPLLLRIAGACAQLGVDGVRADIVTARTARALAALEGLDEVNEDHVLRAAALALAHRRRDDPLGGPAPLAEEELKAALAPEPEPEPDPEPDPDDEGPGPADGERREAPDAQAPARPRRDAPIGARAPVNLRPAGRGRGPAGRRAGAAAEAAGAVDSRPAAPASADPAPVATLLARLADPDAAPREHVRRGREGCLVVLVVDASGSMGARRRMARVKGALLGLLEEAYRGRDRVALIAFRDARAELLARPGLPLDAVARLVEELPTGGRTPLAEGLDAATMLVRRERRREPDRRALAVVLTDGRAVGDPAEAARAAARLGAAADGVWVVDAEEGPVRLGFAGALARAAGGTVAPLVAARRAA